MSADDVSAMSADDLELLRMAARAIGELPDTWVDSEAYFSGVLSRWNPLTDDGDALRLAVAMGNNDGRVCLLIEAASGHDPCASARRAIVRAAAEIGRAMP